MAHVFQILSNAFFTFSYDGWTSTPQVSQHTLHRHINLSCDLTEYRLDRR